MNSSRRCAVLFATAGFFVSGGHPGTACGPWFPAQYLARGGRSLLDPPEFFAEIELKLLAREFPTPFHAIRDAAPQRRNAERDLEDFDAALKDGSIAPPEPAAARQIHQRMRNVLSQLAGLTPAEAAAVPPEVLEDLRKREFPSEFADYHEGVIAYAAADHVRACGIWERLLQRPAGERRYRSVSAAYMLGVLRCVDDQDDAPVWLARARQLAREGFHDSSGVAAATYSWEAEWRQQRGQLHAAAECSLRSIASGYPSRDCISPVDESPEELVKFASDPLLRRIHTALLLANSSGRWTDPKSEAPKVAAWLKALRGANAGNFLGAERVAWVCYQQGDYKAAREWLRHALPECPEALWLAGKLAARDGRAEDSWRAFSRAARLLAARPEPSLESTPVLPDTDTTGSIFAAEHGIAALGAAEFQLALESFLRGGHWTDAAYVADRLLSSGELKSWVLKRRWQPGWDALSFAELDALGKSPAPPVDPDLRDGVDELRVVSEAVRTRQLRWLLGRRLCREGRFLEAGSFLPLKERAELAEYTSALRRGRSTALAGAERAAALWDAALETRYHGMELFGTEAAPDWFLHGGDYEEDDPAAFRTGVTVPREKDGALPAILRAGGAERSRLSRSNSRPNTRFHYRYRAADLAWQATRLLPDNDPRLAEMLDLAGRWLASRDEAAADRFYQALESRCAETEIGQRAIASHWFVDIEKYTIARRPKEPAGEPR